jgi:hypothetical protein
MSNWPDTEIVKITTVDPDTGEEIDTPFFGVAVGDNWSYRITRTAPTLEEVRAEIGNLHDSRALWLHALEHDRPLGHWDPLWDEHDDDGDPYSSVPTAARP